MMMMMIWMRTRLMMMKAPLPRRTARQCGFQSQSIACVGGAAAPNRQDAQRHAADRGRFEYEGVVRRLEGPHLDGLPGVEEARKPPSRRRAAAEEAARGLQQARTRRRRRLAPPPAARDARRRRRPSSGAARGRFAAPPFGTCAGSFSGRRSGVAGPRADRFAGPYSPRPPTGSRRRWCPFRPVLARSRCGGQKTPFGSGFTEEAHERCGVGWSQSGRRRAGPRARSERSA